MTIDIISFAVMAVCVLWRRKIITTNNIMNKTMKNKQFSEKWEGRTSYPSPEVNVFTLGVEAGFCQSKDGQISDVTYLEEVQW